MSEVPLYPPMKRASPEGVRTRHVTITSVTVGQLSNRRWNEFSLSLSLSLAISLPCALSLSLSLPLSSSRAL